MIHLPRKPKLVALIVGVGVLFLSFYKYQSIPEDSHQREMQLNLNRRDQIHSVRSAGDSHNTPKEYSDEEMRLLFSFEEEKRWQLAEEAYQRNLVGRYKTMEDVKIKTFDFWNRRVFLWDFFVPAFTCPFEEERIGGVGDGGKFVCGVDRLKQSATDKDPLIVYSFGVNDDSTFEEDLISRIPAVNIFAYDPTVNKMASPSKAVANHVKFFKQGLSNKTKGEYHTLIDIMDQNGHEWIDILKIDCEGCEFDAFRQITSSFANANSDDPDQEGLPFGQLLIELHYNDKTFDKMLHFFESLEKGGLRPFRNELNLFTAMKRKTPKCIEYSFVNTRGRSSNRLLPVHDNADTSS